MTNGTNKTASKVIAYLVLILALVGIIGVIARFTGGFTEEIKTFYVTVDGKAVTTSSEGYMLSAKSPFEVEVKNPFSTGNDEQKPYTVKVVPHVVENKDFNFTINEATYSFQAQKDFTKGFDIQYSTNSFTIKPKGGLMAILQSVYPNYIIGECEEKAYTDMFTLVVTSSDGQSSVYLHFSVEAGISGIAIDKSQILL